MQNENTSKGPSEKKENPLLNLAVNVIIPSVILTKFSTEEHLGQFWGLIIALIFPIGYGVFDFIMRKKINFFSGLGLFSVLMTGGIGLFRLDRDWMVIKETAIPLLMGITVISSQFFGVPLVRGFLNQIIDLDKIDESFKESGHGALFLKKLKISSFLLGGTFFISALLNYILAIKILVGEPGSVEFNESLGKMTALSFPVISVPMLIMVGMIMFYLFSSVKKLTDLDIESVLRN